MTQITFKIIDNFEVQCVIFFRKCEHIKQTQWKQKQEESPMTPVWEEKKIEGGRHSGQGYSD